MIALPHKAITKKDDPKLVRFPNPLMASGQILAYIKELGSPIATRNQSEISVSMPKNVTVPDENMIKKDNSRSNKAQRSNA